MADGVVKNTADIPDFTLCDVEPIHIPGSIQPHGVLLVVEWQALLVSHVAGDLEGRLGMCEWQDRPLASIVGDAIGLKIAALREPGSGSGFVGQLRAPRGETFDVSAHPAGDHLLVEIEAASAEPLSAMFVLDRLAAATGLFERALSLPALCARAAGEFRTLTGFDRVMIYRFIEGGVGVVISEDLREGMYSFLNHRFPASDIPRQARALYLHNLVRVIPDATYRPAEIRPAWSDGSPLDMTDSHLRSVSPVHLQYLANMGVRASASISIVKEGALWGLIACHHETPRALTYEIRAACRSLAAHLGRQITAKEEAEGYRQSIRLRSFTDEIVQLFSMEEPLARIASRHLSELGRMMHATGVAVLRGAELAVNGVCLADADIRALACWILERAPETVFSSNSLRVEYPSGASLSEVASGVLAITLSADEPWILLWFRIEQIETVNWAGNPHKSVNVSPQEQLTPRASFESWKESVVGCSRAWTLPELQAASRLREALIDMRQTRRVTRLNEQLTIIVRDRAELLKQKEFLIGEINHRVQNSLQLVSSFLALQSRGSTNTELQGTLEEARRRLSSVALVHRRLYRGDKIDIIDAARYIEELCADTLSFMGPEWAQHLTLDLAPVMVSTDVAVPMGLVFTELMINSNKYAYGGKAGPVSVQLTAGHTTIVMVVADSGVGIPLPRKGFGSRIIEGLVGQLNGTLTYGDNAPGLRISVEIPMQAAVPAS